VTAEVSIHDTSKVGYS